MRLIVHCNIQGCMVTLFTLHHSHTYLHVGGCCDTVGGCSTDVIPPETHRFYTKLTTDILVKRVAFHLSVPQAQAQAEGGEGANTVVADGLAAEAALDDPGLSLRLTAFSRRCAELWLARSGRR